jgi:hypothetical protein
MHTSASDHIIVHFQIINKKNYIRIITTSNTNDYFKEIKTVYNQDISIHDECISIFYNCGELYDRLINDLNFKKFKDVDKVTNIFPTLWLVEIKNDILNWFNNTYVSWIKSRLNMYIEDLDDNFYFDPLNVKWNETGIKDYVKIKYLDDLKNTNYILQECEKNKDGHFIFTRDHFLSLILFYINNNYAKLFDLNSTEIDTEEKSTLLINQCDYLRGLTLNKYILETIDVEKILKTLNINNIILGNIGKSKDFIETYEIETLDQFNNSSETNIFGNLTYAFIDNKEIICQGDIEKAYEIIENKSGKNPIELYNDLIKNKFSEEISVSLSLNPLKEVKIVEPIKKTKILFKNLITNIVHAYDNNIKLLKEFNLLSSFSYENTFTSKIIEHLEEFSLSPSLINEMKELTSILDNVICDDSLESKAEAKTEKSVNFQKHFTDLYVQSYKNDKSETVASTVIDNVYNYLVPLHPKNETINRNQIGTDLVDLGIKKTRKSKGYVYGIEDSSLTSSNLLPLTDEWVKNSSFKELTMNFKVDQAKVTKCNNQIRLEPAVNVNKDLFIINTPSKFVQ